MSAIDSKLRPAVATRLLAGVSVPDTPVISRAIEYAREHSEPYLFNHVMRSWLFAVILAQLNQSAHDAEVLAVTTILHDLGLAKAFDGPLRFEVEGANAARAFARNEGIDDRRGQLIWDGVALNSTPSIGLYKETEVALCTAGIGLDWGGWGYDKADRGSGGNNRRRVSSAGNEATIHPRCLRHCRDTPRHDVRQLRTRFRRALRARLQASIDGGLSAEFPVQGVGDARRLDAEMTTVRLQALNENRAGAELVVE